MPDPVVMEIPGVGVVEFPAGMSMPQIEQAAAKMHAEAVQTARQNVKPARAEDFMPAADQSPVRQMANGQGMWTDVKNEAFNLLGNAWQALKPWDRPSDIIAGPIQAVRNPKLALDLLWSALRDSHVDQAQKTAASARGVVEDPTLSGKLQSAAGTVLHGAATVVPAMGPALASGVEQMAEGDVSGGAGRLLGIGGSVIAGNKMAASRGPTRVSLANRNPVMREAVQFGERNQIPIDAATATDRPIVARVQQRMSDTLGGAGRAEAFKREQDAALAATGRRLADRAHPAPMTAEAAGQGVRDAVTGNVKKFHAEADQAYSALRALEQKQQGIINQHGGIQAPNTAAKPFASVPLAVDIAPTKAALRPLYQQLMREKDLVGTLQGGKARTLVALDTLMNGPNQAPLSVVDAALGDLKAMARGAEMPELRTGGQATAAAAVKELDKQVRATAAQWGPDVVKALEDGRRATVAKYEAGGVLKGLNDEPVRSFNKLTAREDISVEHLREVANQAPQELPKMGRAFLDDLLEKATADGRFEHAAAIATTWEKLGPQTKAMLFQQPGHVRELDNFFRLARKMAENPNPSGTARNLTATNVALAIPASLIAKLMYSPGGVRMLTQGLSIPTSNKAAAAAFRTRAMKLAGERGAAPMPTAAEDQRDEQKKAGR